MLTEWFILPAPFKFPHTVREYWDYNIYTAIPDGISDGHKWPACTLNSIENSIHFLFQDSLLARDGF